MQFENATAAQIGESFTFGMMAQAFNFRKAFYNTTNKVEMAGRLTLGGMGLIFFDNIYF